jgi:serine phosphatase RsbU (regulator of sigma subunit)
VAFPKKWKYCKGDNPSWASPQLNDSLWPYLPTSLDLYDVPEGAFEGKGWFRLCIDIAPQLVNKPLALLEIQWGASEFYLDGKLIQSFGKIPQGNEPEERYDPRAIPVYISFSKPGKHVLAVRYYNSVAVKNFKDNKNSEAGFTLRLGELDRSVINYYKSSNVTNAFFIFYFAFFLASSILHLCLYLFYRANRSNLYYSIFTAGFGLFFLFLSIEYFFLYPDFRLKVLSIHNFLPDIYITALLAMLYSIFSNNRLPRIFWIWAAYFGTDALLEVFGVDIPYSEVISNLILIIEPIRIVIAAMIKKKDGAWIIGAGIICTIVFFIMFFTMPFFTRALYLSNGVVLSVIVSVLTVYFTLNIPLSMTLYLARDFSKTNKSLQKKLVEVEELSAKSIEQEKEKQKILETQNEVLEKKVDERTREISEQKKLIEEKNKDITDSISYAKRLQEAMLPQLSQFAEALPQSFVLYKPKDIVAGDFYWMEVVSAESAESRRQAAGRQMAGTERSQTEGQTVSVKSDVKNLVLVAAADCTGHGVPGAMVSVVCSNALKRTVNEFGITEPGKILDKVRQLVIETFEKSQTIVKDGMDISLISIRYLNESEAEIQWSGANNPLWYIQNGESGEIAAHKQPIGKTEDPTPFPTHKLTLRKGDLIFLFTDGYADQFGGSRGKKFKYRQMLDLFKSSEHFEMRQMKETVDKAFEEWKGNLEQVDDVCIIGIRV